MTEPTPSPLMPITPAVHRIFTATLIIGVPGSGKTTLFKGFAEYLWETYQKVLLLYSWDGGAIPTDVQKRMKQGLIRFWRARTRSAPGLALETLYLASRGYWPRQIHAETGETSPAVELVAPVTTRYTVSCKQGHPLSTVPSRALIAPMFCTPCNQFVPLQDLQVIETAQRTRGFEAVGGVGFDGLTSMTDVVLDHMDLQRGEGLIGGEKPAFGGVVVSGSQKFGGNNRADIGFGQSRGHQFVNNSLSIPYLVEGPVFTALAMEATDEGGLPIVGPKLPGRAATDEGSAWFGNVMETGKTQNDQGQECFTLFLRPFTDPQNRRHLLKTSASPTGVPDRLVDPAMVANQPYLNVNLGKVFLMLDEDLRRSLLEELPGAPGTPAGISEYGEPLMVTTAAAIPARPMMPLQAVIPAPIVVPMGAAPVGVAAPTIAGPALMIAKPRTRKNGPQTLPLAEASAASGPEVPAAAVASAPPVVPTAVSAAVVPMSAPSGTTPPPPPGMRPPMKAPGA